MARNKVIGAVVIAGVAAVIGGIMWQLHSRTADARSDRDRWERRHRTVCQTVHSGLYQLKSAMPLYARHVRESHSDVPRDAADVPFGSLHTLLSAHTSGLSAPLQACLSPEDSGVRLGKIDSAKTQAEANALIDDLMRSLEARYGFAPIAEIKETP